MRKFVQSIIDCLKNENRTNRIYLFSITLVFIFVLILYDFGLFITIFDDELAKLSHEENGIDPVWIGFWGSILGALFQGIVTAAGIMITLKIYQNDQKDKKNAEEKQKRDKEKEEFIKGFDKKIIAYDGVLSTIKTFKNVKEFRDQLGFQKLQDYALEINEGELIARVVFLRRQEASLERFLQQKNPNPQDQKYLNIDGQVRRNLRHLEEKVKQQQNSFQSKFKEYTGIDISEESLWDQGRTFEGQIISGLPGTGKVYDNRKMTDEL